MSKVVLTRGIGECSICLEDFLPSDVQVTHEGAERHHAFHKVCLAKWLIRQSNCPVDRQPIDQSSLVSRTDLIRSRFGLAIKAVARGTFSSATVVGIVRGVLGGMGRVESRLQIDEPRMAMMQSLGFVAGGAAVLGISLAVEAGISTAIERFTIEERFEDVAERIYSHAGGAAAFLVGSQISLGTREEALVTAISMIPVGLIAAMRARAMRNVVNENTGWSILAGGCIPLICGLYFGRPLATLSTGSPLIVGAMAGALTLVRS